MTASHKHEPGTPMPYANAPHLLNPIRALVLSPGALVRRLGLKPDFMVLELGPGPGYFSPAVARAVPKGKLVLVDVQQEMLEMAKKRLDGQGVANAEYRQGDALSLPAEDGSFDVAFLVAVLGELPDRDRSLEELHRVLRQDGLLSVTEMRVFDPDAVPLAELQSSVEAAGFRRCSRHGRLLHYTLGFRKLS
jgi:ubiquinone/menaquinone biosynthesis C-methylase UbiE